MMKKMLAVCSLFLALGTPALAQSSDKKAIQEVVESFLLHLGDKEYDKVAADLAPKALVLIARERDGQWSNSFQTGDEWVAALKKNPNPTTFREPITNVSVTIDSDRLAYLRADFTIMRDGKAQSHGVDHFTLVRDGGAWKLAVLAFTSMPIR
jgi:ketosteroid isomerase-like protein